MKFKIFRKQVISILVAIIIVLLPPSVIAKAEDGDIVVFDDKYSGVSSFITFDSDYKVVCVGDSVRLHTILYDGSSGNGAVEYISSNEEILTVDENGNAEALQTGECTVTAVALGSGKEAVCTVRVIDKAERTVTISLNSASILVNTQLTLTARCNDSTAKLMWVSDNNAVATVDDGVVTAVSEGTATITVMDDSLTAKASCKVTVYLENSLSLFAESTSVYVGNHIKIVAETPAEDSVSWSSSNENIATVDENGIVKGIKAGKAVITATCGGDEKSASVEITVLKAPSSNISLTTDTLEIRNGQSFYMKAHGYSGSVEWISHDENIVTVDENGIVTGKKRGVAIISAKSSDGKYVDTAVVTVKGLAPIKFTYTSPNNAPINTPVTLYAITDTLRDNVRFTVYENGTEKTIEATNRQEDAGTFIWSASYTFTSSGTHEVKASALYNGTEWASGEFASTTAFVISSENNEECTLDERRVSNELIALLGSFEGYSSSYYKDTLANNILTMGFGKVIYEGNYFFDNLTKAEATAYLINDTNNGAYTTRVNKFLREKSIAFNQNQFDSLVCFSYNLGTGWISKSDLSTLIQTSSFVQDTDTDLKEGDKAMVNVSDSLRLRSGPGTDTSVIGYLYRGDIVTLIEAKLYNKDWYHVKTEDGKEGYCHKDYLIFISGNSVGSLANIEQDDLVNEMLQWHKASGKCVKGLLYRRIDELEVFLFAEYTHDGSRNKHGFELPTCH